MTKISELTATSTELNYVDGVTSSIQTQLDAKLQYNVINTTTNVSASVDDFILVDGTLNAATFALREEW